MLFSFVNFVNTDSKYTMNIENIHVGKIFYEKKSLICKKLALISIFYTSRFVSI